VAAIPLGTFLGDLWGWRWVFVLAAGIGVVALAFQASVLPSVSPTGAPGLRTLAATARSKVIIRGLAALGLIAGGHFAAFTYIRPAAELIPGLKVESLAVVLLTYGVGGVVGNLVSGPLADRRMRTIALLAPLLIGVGTIFLALGTVLPAAIAAAAIWGFAFGAVPTVVQTWMARAAPDRLESAGGLVVATFQVAIALGAAVGGLAIDVFDVRVVLVGGGLTAIAGGVLLATARTIRRADPA
jgi:DHA1 family purine ribonucleoside efflux pump-like MFS transporter